MEKETDKKPKTEKNKLIENQLIVNKYEKSMFELINSNNMDFVVASMTPKEVFRLSSTSNAMKTKILDRFEPCEATFGDEQVYLLKAKHHDFWMPNFAVESSRFPKNTFSRYHAGKYCFALEIKHDTQAIHCEQNSQPEFLGLLELSHPFEHQYQFFFRKHGDVVIAFSNSSKQLFVMLKNTEFPGNTSSCFLLFCNRAEIGYVFADKVNNCKKYFVYFLDVQENGHVFHYAFKDKKRKEDCLSLEL